MQDLQSNKNSDEISNTTLDYNLGDLAKPKKKKKQIKSNTELT